MAKGLTGSKVAFLFFCPGSYSRIETASGRARAHILIIQHGEQKVKDFISFRVYKGESPRLWLEVEESRLW